VSVFVPPAKISLGGSGCPKHYQTSARPWLAFTNSEVWQTAVILAQLYVNAQH